MFSHECFVSIRMEIVPQVLRYQKYTTIIEKQTKS